MMIQMTEDKDVDCPRFNLHVKLLKSVFVIKTLARFLPLVCMKTLYFAYFHSHLTYGMLVWCPMLTRASQNELYLLQKRTVRCIFKAPFRSHTQPLFRKENILNLSDQVFLDNCKFIYRVVNGRCAWPLSNFYISGNNLYGTRSENVTITKHQSGLLNRSFLCKAVIVWRNISSDIKKSEHLRIFSRKAKKLL